MTTTPSCLQEKMEAALPLFQELLPVNVVAEWCREFTHQWRQCCWTPLVTLWAGCWKQIQPQASVRAVEDWVASVLLQRAAGMRDGSDFCAARQRLPLNIWRQAARHLGAQAVDAGRGLYRQLWVLWVDGSTLRAENTTANEKHFGRGRNACRASRSPLTRIVVVLCAGSGAVLDYVLGPYAQSELALWWDLLSRLKPGHLLVADRAYAAYLVMAEARGQGQQLLARLPSRRQGTCVRRWSAQDELQEWRRPARSASAFPERLATCPLRQEIRVITWVVEEPGYRAWTLRLATTLTNPRKYPARELVQQYLRRWGIELQLRTLKTYYGLARLTAKSPDVCEKEVCAALMAYNLVTAFLCRSGEPPLNLSHERSRVLLQRYWERGVAVGPVQAATVQKELFGLLPGTLLKRKKRPPQPRAIVQRPSTFPVLMTTRAKWRAKYLAS